MEITELAEATFDTQASEGLVIQSLGEETRRRSEIELQTTIAKREDQNLKQNEKIQAVRGSDPALAQRLDRHVKLIQPTLFELIGPLRLTERNAFIGTLQVARLGYNRETPFSGSSDLMMVVLDRA